MLQSHRYQQHKLLLGLRSAQRPDFDGYVARSCMCRVLEDRPRTHLLALKERTEGRLLNICKTAHRRPDGDHAPFSCVWRKTHPAVVHRHFRCCNGELAEASSDFRGLCGHPKSRIEVTNFTRKPAIRRQLRSIEQRSATD